jgi:hypothetical protein
VGWAASNYGHSFLRVCIRNFGCNPLIKRDYSLVVNYGKGTVQNVIDLNQFVRSSDIDLGALNNNPKVL